MKFAEMVAATSMSTAEQDLGLLVEPSPIEQKSKISFRLGHTQVIGAEVATLLGKGTTQQGFSFLIFPQVHLGHADQRARCEGLLMLAAERWLEDLEGELAPLESDIEPAQNSVSMG